MAAALNSLFRPLRLAEGLELPNRVVMAPMTRSMAGPELVPTDAMAAYYARRAAAGLIVTEATVVRPDGQGYPHTPGIFTENQVEGWRRTTDAVHQRGGRIFLQLWHVGRVSHPKYLGGELPVAPSAVALGGRVPRTDNLTYGTPRALETSEIPEYALAYARGAANAIRAGFDGVEVHGANGYLVDQFLHWHTNRREDAWGGTPEKMVRFALTVIDSVIGEVGAGRAGIRLSPGAYFNMEDDRRDAEVFRLLLSELSRRPLAYVHAGIFDDGMRFDTLGGSVTEFLRAHFDGVVIGNGAYTPETGAEALAAGRFDLVAIGRLFIANPDLIAKITDGGELREYKEAMLLTLE